MGYCILRIEKIKSIVAANGRLKHNRRQTECLTTNPEKKNVCIILNEQMRKDKHKSFREIFHERVKGQKIRKNAVIAVEIVLTFSPGSVPDEKLREWVGANTKWLKDTFGGNIIDCQLHRDQKTPHLHCILILRDEKGKLSSRSYLGGTRQVMANLQTSYAKAMEPFGLERGVSREITRARHTSTKKWLNMQAEKEARLSAYETKFGTEDTWNFDDMLEFRKLLRHDETKPPVDLKECKIPELAK